ncbi:LysM peptidoglycan-binding domain-containing protein [Undibacterium sp. Jales W-56]|uniref:FimV/HubP family polar landmark protein n=1 Tax=Undibacterium sp. Jales W-56 TaxID=2897325 RepID=UPI0021D39E42|nr:FimV/HubP family polar landmark protein [Undibacterium sp. Jales W-56]MCU6433934.1 LysM peptidoglycan-binding domain-containing protein [Undibacterium sp. Jales W-56]
MSYKMHNYKRSPVTFLGAKVLGAAVASSLFMLSSAYATGLGKLTVLSSLGQPLRAEIELTSPNKDEIGSLVPKLASSDAFRQASIDFNPALLSLRFSVEQRGPGYVIRISSNQAMNEPFVDMLLELNSSNGKLLREYTFLLDPAELRNSQSAQVANPVTVAGSTQATTTQAPLQTRPLTTPAQQQTSVERKASATKNNAIAPAKPAGDYQVKPGDTLSKIAGSYKAEGVSLDQMLVSLYKANPQAFAGNNMNRLKSGQILTVPDGETSRSTVSTSEAHSVVMAHANDFSSYRNKLAGQVANAPAEKVTSTKQTASGVITAKVKEVPTATNESLDKLKLSKAAPNASAKSATGKAIDEDKIAKDKAIADANARVKELEKNVENLQKILEVKNKDLSDKQAAAKSTLASASAKSTAVSVPAPAPTPAPSSAPVLAPSPAPVAASAAGIDSAASAPPVKVMPKKKVLPPPPPPEPGFFDSVMDSGFLLPGAGVLLALLGGYGVFSSRRKKKLQQFEDSILTGSSMKANSMFGSTGGQSVDTNNSVFNSNFAPSASQLDANEVDPVAEADVYIAYGRDSQAEEILKEALRTQPDRHAVRVKLLEIYFTRKDAKSFERLAGELYGMTSGEGEDWAQAASMGISLDPTNPLYAGGKVQSDSATGVMGSATQPLEDLDQDALLANSLTHDMLESINIIDTASGPEKDKAPALHQEDMSFNIVDTHADIDALDFDLNIPGSDAAPELEVPKIPEALANSNVSKHEEPAPEEIVDFASIDFDLGGDEHTADALPDHVPGATPAAHVENQLNVDHLDVNASENISNDPNVIAFESAMPPAEIHAPLPEIGEHHVTHSIAAEVPAAFEFDLSSIDLNLEPEATKSEATNLHHQEAPAYNAEMATKLDLAVAYHEIGDKDGARELLDEVVKGGTSDQIAKAKEMLAQLS